MDLNNLKVYYEVCKNRSFTKASEGLFISQSAVSIQIKKLEQNLGVQLIERDSKNFRLTLAGKKVYKMSKDIFGKLVRVENDIKRIIDTDQTKIVIGATHNIGEPILPGIIKDYCEQNKNVLFDIYVKNSVSLVQKLKEGEIDLVLAEDIVIDDEELKVIYTDDYPFIIAAPKFVKKYEDLKKIYFLKRENTQTSYYVEQFEDIIGFKHNKEMLVNGSIETIKNMIANGLGYSVLPYYCAYDRLEKKEIKMLHKFDKTHNKFQILFMKENSDNKILNDFITYLRSSDITKPLKE